MDRIDDTSVDATTAAGDGSADPAHAVSSAADAALALVVDALVPFPGDGLPGDIADPASADADDAGSDPSLAAPLAALSAYPSAGMTSSVVAEAHWGHDSGARETDEAAAFGTSAFSAAAQVALLAPLPADFTGEERHPNDDAFLPKISFAAAAHAPPAPIEAAIAGPDPELIPNDPMFPSQWHLQAINVQSVWNDYTGTGVLLGLIDDGVEYTHPDLAANYNTALDYDARNRDNDAFTSSTSDQHGTSVAGTMAAVGNNNLGVTGVAYGATIVGFRMGFGSAGSVSQITDAFQHAIAVDVVNNSWGYSGYFSDNFATSTFAATGAAVQNDAANGRGGLGTIIVFAAGNSRTSGDNVDYHSFQDSKYVISVAATDSTNHYTYFSNPGAGLLISAPGLNITTTDRVGSLGFSSGDYTTVSGTSFSAPIVSGVVALMLEANPNLGYRDVQEILAYSADKIDPTNARWSTNGADNWNGGGLHFSTDYGFGLVDAHAAVRMAETWTVQSTYANMVTAAASKAAAQAIPDNNPAGISQTVTIGSNILIDHVEVDLNITHTWIGDLRVILIAPDGTQSVLVDRPGINPDTESGTGTSQDNINFTVDSNQFWGENSAGQWTLVVSDNNAGQTGTLNSWTLHVYGDTATSDDTYIYTDEYAGMTGAANVARRLLTDSNGGHDTINLAAVTSSTFLDMTPGHISTVAGNTLTIAAGTLIEDAYLGDGNDTVVGNSADNVIMGGRGNDTLDGGAGTDTAVYSGPSSEYSIVYDSVHFTYTVTDNVPSDINDGQDVLSNFEYLQFSNLLYALTVGPSNTPPTASNDTAATPEDTAVTVSVLTNDTDPDGDTLSVTSATNPAHGAAVVNPNGTITYTPGANYNGADSFSYTISDGHGNTSQATVSVNVTPVNDPPVANNDSATTNEDTPVIIAVTANDTDVENDALTVTGTSSPAHGTVAINANNTVTYTPALNYNGADSFTYTISDGHGGTSSATVNLTINPVNDPPVANPDSATTTQNIPVTINVLANDTDVENDALTVTGTSSPAHGTVVINAGTTVTYTPTSGYTGADSFTYSISDGHGGTASATVSVAVGAVNSPPTAANDSATTNEDTPVTVNVLTNDTDPNNDALTVTGTGSPAHGTVAINANNTVTYTPALNYNGADSFTYTISDGHGGTSSATVNLTINPVNDPPVANPDTVTINEDTSVAISVLANDTDVENDTLTLTGASGALHGTLTPNLVAGTVTYTPNVNYNGSDSFTYTISDGHGGTATGNVSVTVNPVNDPPVANDDSATTNQNAPVNIAVLLNDTDVDGDALSVTSTTSPAHGTVVVNSGIVTYTPTAGYTGSDSFNYSISDGHGGTASANVALTVLAAPLGPVTLIDAHFDASANGFVYFDDAFRGTSNPSYESGTWVSSGGFSGGALEVKLGGIDGSDVQGMSGGWEQSFNLSSPTDVVLTFHYDLMLGSKYETNEYGQVLVSIDGTLYGANGQDYVTQLNGHGHRGGSVSSGWQTFTVDLGQLSAGDHTVIIGGFNNHKNATGEETTLLIDDVNLTTNPGSGASSLNAPLDSSNLQGTQADTSPGHQLDKLMSPLGGGPPGADNPVSAAATTAHLGTGSGCGQTDPLKLSDILDTAHHAGPDDDGPRTYADAHADAHADSSPHGETAFVAPMQELMATLVNEHAAQQAACSAA